jgi:membrane associated rhomboid family serine protease
MAWHSTWNDPPPRPGLMVDRGGLFPPGVKLVIFATVAVFVADVLGKGWLSQAGALSVDTLMRLELWRVVTYMFLHAGVEHILINLFIFWMLGMVLERQIGTKRFLSLYFVSGIVGGLFEVAFNMMMYLRFGEPLGHYFLEAPAVGASAGVMGVLIAFATLNPRAKFLFFFLIPMEAWLLALLYAAFETWPIIDDLFLHPGRGLLDNVAHAAHFGGMIVGFVWIKWGDQLAGFFRPTVDRSPQPFVERPPDEENAELDRILDKIHHEGLDSLTMKERLFLQEISRKRRGGPQG